MNAKEDKINDLVDMINDDPCVEASSLAELAKKYSLTMEGEVIVVDDTIFANDGECEVAYPNHSRIEAAEAYVHDGDWGEQTRRTQWITVSTYKKGIGKDRHGFVEVMRYDMESHKITLEPEAPECIQPEHDWCSPELLGGLKENPGVIGYGGGAISTQACRHCGRYRVVNTWAQDPCDGMQGLESVEYQSADDESKAWVERELLKDRRRR